MKMHLYRPGSSSLTMCGIQIKAFSTSDPKKMTCKRCLLAYLVRLQKMGKNWMTDERLQEFREMILNGIE